MKKVLKFVKGKKDERKDESGGLTPSQSGDLISPAQTPEDERFLGLDSSFGYVVDFNGKDKSLTKLHKAAWQGNLEKLKSALKKVDIDASDKHNRTALHFAVVQGHPNIVWFLLGNNANTSVCDDDGCTPLLKAIECGHKECLKLLLERSTDINATDYTGNTGLHVAVKQGSLDIVSVLLSKNANTEVSNNAGDYPLHIATKSENKDFVDLLVNSGADVNVLDRENRTPLMLAAKSGNALLTDLFVEYGSQLTVVDSNGWAADDYALLGGHDDIASSLKALIRAKKEKSKEIQGVHEQNAASESNKEDENSVSWGDNPSSNSSDKTDRVAKKLKEFFRTCSKDEETGNEAIALAKPKDKEEDTIESPNSEVMPPFCQPPRSWDMIQAGMIDGNKPGSETKRLGITTLGTLHSRRESFTEGQSVNSPRFTLSLNRRKGAKGSNSFAKQRLSFNEEVTLKQMTFENSKIRSDDKAPVVAAAVVSRNITGDDPETDVNCKSMDVKEVPSDISDGIQPADSSDWDSSEKDSGTLGRPDTMKMSEEIWVSETKEAGFPSPPSALELGADMARSLKYMKGVSEDYPLGSTAERNLWRNAYETHSLDCLEEKSHVESGRLESEVGYFQQQSTSSLRWKSQEIPRRQKSLDRLVDVNKRINEQLECYDQALRELAETSTRKNSLSAASEKSFNSVNYYSLPSSKVRVTDGDTERNSVPKMRPTGKPTNGGPCRTPPQTSTCLTAEKCDNNEELGQEHRETVKVNEEADVRKAKRQILMAMRDVKHAIQVSSVFKTSFDDQVLSPLTKPENSVELDDSDSPKRTAGDTEKGSPQGLAFFSLGRQETVLERKSSSSGTDEPTLWLQNNGHGKQDNGSDEDVSEISEERGHKRVSPFSPLGVIYQEIKNERRSDEKDSPVELDDINLKTEGGGVRSSLFRRFNGESEDQKEIAPDQSPDISLSSGPIEPLGTEKDSGSDPESNDHDITPTHHYSLKDQQEWLKSHLKTATTEKNRLEEITAHLMEKAERLQYELADAREATKSRDEVIKLLQEQLARMEVAYTKSLEESVQSKLQLSSHEQEILHLKEICYKYEEEENKEIAEAEVNSLVKLESKIKRLEGENEKMKEEIVHLKGEKTSLAKRLKEVTESDQRQRWKERCEEEEEKNRDNVQNESNSKTTNGTNEREKMLKELNVELEKKISSMAEENKELNSKVQMLLGEVESEKKIMSVKKEMSESVCEMKKKNLEMEAHVKHLEKEIEEKKVLNVREKEKEIEFLVKQFSQEKELLIKFYERKLVDRAGEDSKLKDTLQRLHDLVGDLEVKYSKETVQDALKNELFELRDQCDLVSKSVAEMQNRDNHDVNFLLRENINLQKEINEIKINLPKDDQVIDFKEKYVALACENVKMKNVILELKNQVNSLTVLVNSESRSQGATKSENSTKQSENENVCVESSRRRKGVEMGNHLAWRNLYGIKKIEKSHGWKPERSDEGEIPGIRPSVSDTTEKLEMLRLKKKVALLQDKISGEKAMREALETQISEINRDLKEKGSLEQEVLSLKRKLNREHLQKLDLELAQYQKELQGKREKYLEEVSKSPGIDEYREKCEMLAKEREKSKEIRNKILEKGHIIQEHGWSPSMASTQHEYPTISLAEPELRGLHPQFGPLHSSTSLEPEIKHHLEKELERSIRKYKAGTSTTPTVTSSNLRVDLLKETEST